MKLLYIHDEALSSEKANMIQVLHMCYAFSLLNINVTLAIPEENKNVDSIKDIIKKKINKTVHFSVETYPYIKIYGRLKMIGGFIGVNELLKKSSADLCYVRNPVFLNATLPHKIPTIFESHNSLLHERSKILDYFWKKNLVKNSKSNFLIKFVTISKALADSWIQKGILEKKIIHLHDGVDSESFSLIPDQITLRQDLHIPLNKRIVLYAGSLYKNRGIENILMLAKCFPKVNFIVIGGPEDRKNYYINISLEKNLSNISFLGSIPHHKVKDYLFAADILLMIWTRHVKTINYCSPLKMFEYMAAGRIIVGHAFPTINEVLTDKETAYLADPDSFEDLKSKLSLALEQSYPNRMTQAARTLALQKYSWKFRAQSILNCYKNVLAEEFSYNPTTSDFKTMN